MNIVMFVTKNKYSSIIRIFLYFCPLVRKVYIMHKRIIILLAVVLGFSTLRVEAQDAMFSQFFANPLYLNPAFAGTNVCPRLAFNFRDQWPKASGTFMTYTASYDEHFDKLSGGVGVLLMGDRAGEGGCINTYAASAIYSFKIKVSKKFNLRLSLQATYQQKSLNWGLLTFGDMIDPKYGFVYATQEQQPNKLSRGVFDMSAGLLGYTPHVYFGMAAHHITRPYEGFLIQSGSDSPEARLPVKWTAHVGANFDLKRKSKKETSFGDISISPNFIYQHQMNFNYFNEGLYLNFYPFTVGLWYRECLHNSDAFIVMFGVEHEYFKIAYSYDATVGQLANVTGGSHEVSLQLLLPCPKKRQAIKDLVCPSF